MDIYTNAENVRTQMRRGVLEYCILCILSKKDSYATSILSELKAARMTDPSEEPGAAHLPLGGVSPGSPAEILSDNGQGPSGSRRDGLRMAGAGGVNRNH